MRETMQFHPSFFVDQLISTGLWPLHSPDLSSLDFHLWGHLKDKVFRTAPATIHEFKARITEEIKKMDCSVKNVFSNLIKCG